MTKKKTQEPVTYLLQEDKALEMLALYNALDKMLDDAAEMFDVNLSTLGDLRHNQTHPCLLYTSPSPRDGLLSRMPSSA